MSLLPAVAAALLVVGALVIVRAPGPLSLRALALYPRRTASRLVGFLATRRIPRSLREPILGAFARRVGADTREAEKPLVEYESLQAFFTRRLVAGLRPQSPVAPGSINCPVDGRIVGCGRVERDTAIQAKGLPYRISELLPHDPDGARFEGGHYVTLYLAPRDYHRIHAPLEGRVTAVGRCAGDLWPVNDTSTAHVPGLYVRNRRATWVATGTGHAEGLEVAVVLVGALHVGGVEIDARWLSGRTLPRSGSLRVDDLPCAAGDDLGVFQFGSTVIVLVGGPRAASWQALRTTGDVRVGERLGPLT